MRCSWDGVQTTTPTRFHWIPALAARSCARPRPHRCRHRVCRSSGIRNGCVHGVGEEQYTDYVSAPHVAEREAGVRKENEGGRGSTLLRDENSGARRTVRAFVPADRPCSNEYPNEGGQRWSGVTLAFATKSFVFRSFLMAQVLEIAS